MKTALAIATALAVIALPVAASAATKHRHHHHARAGYNAYARAPGQIACTQYGCMPVPRGCHPEAGRTWDGLPSGFDVITCGYSTMYGNR
jgi:hypothetical protein